MENDDSISNLNSKVFRAPDELHIGAVGLRVTSMERMLDFYHDFLGLEILRSKTGHVELGFGNEQPLLVLRQAKDAIGRPANAAGLYHFALLTPGRMELAHALRRLLRAGYPLQGAADHFVSEALYLADPEGNGIEIYADRPRERWEWNGDQVRIGTVPLDIDSLLMAGMDEPDEAAVLSAGVEMGHIHLQVTNLKEAMTFYGNTLGLDSMGLYGASAAFYSAGGYHHHIGLNTWASAGGPKAQPEMVGLFGYELVLPGSKEMDTLIGTLQERTFSRVGGGIEIEDPSGNRVFLRPEHDPSLLTDV